MQKNSATSFFYTFSVIHFFSPETALINRILFYLKKTCTQNAILFSCSNWKILIFYWSKNELIWFILLPSINHEGWYWDYFLFLANKKEFELRKQICIKAIVLYIFCVQKSPWEQMFLNNNPKEKTEPVKPYNIWKLTTQTSTFPQDLKILKQKNKRDEKRKQNNVEIWWILATKFSPMCQPCKMRIKVIFF